MRVASVLVLVVIVALLASCHLIYPFKAAPPPKVLYFKGCYNGTHPLSSWGDYFEIDLKQDEVGLIKGTGKSIMTGHGYSDFVITGYSTEDAPTKAVLYLHKVQATKLGPVYPTSATIITSTVPDGIELLVYSPNTKNKPEGSVYQKFQLSVCDKTLIGGS